MKNTFKNSLMSLLLSVTLVNAQTTNEEQTPQANNTLPEETKVVLTMQSIYSERFPVFKMEKAWADSIREKTEEEVSIEYLPAGSVISHTETLDAIKYSVIDGHISLLGYFEKTDPAFVLLGDMVGAMSDPQDVIDFFNSKQGYDLMEKVHEKEVTYIGATTTGLDSMISKKKISGVDDLKDLRLRSPEGLVTNILREAGAVPIALKPTEVAASLTSDVIDAADFAFFGFNHEMGMHKFAPFPVYPGFHSLPVHEVAVNSTKWQTISPKSQDIIRKSIKDFANDMLETFKTMDQKALLAVENNDNISVITWPPQEMEKFFKIAQKVRADIATKSKKAKLVKSSIENYLKK